jgi:YVTN family beta-propeller protein
MNGSDDLRRKRGVTMALAVAIGLLLVVNAGSGAAAPGVNAACYPTQQAMVTVQQSPHGVAVNSAAKRLYVVNYDSNTLTVINSQTYAVVKTVAGGNGPNGVAYNPTNNLIYIAARNSNKVRVMRASDYSLVKTISVGSQPNGIAVNATTNRIYVANYGSGTVSVISGSTNTVIKTLAVGSEPSMLVVNPATNKAYVSLHGAGRIAVISGTSTVTSVDIYSAGPYGIALDAQRNLVYVATIDTFRIAVVNAATNQFLGWAEIRKMPNGEPVPLRMIAVDPAIGSSGHVFVTTAAIDGGWNKVLALSKGWPEYFARAYALDLRGPREGIAFEASSKRLFVTSRATGRLAVYQDGEPYCPTNFGLTGYQVTVCVANPDGTCQEVVTH